MGVASFQTPSSSTRQQDSWAKKGRKDKVGQANIACNKTCMGTIVRGRMVFVASADFTMREWKMKEGICSKCGAASVYRRVNGITWEVAGGVVIHGIRGVLPGSRVESYVCTRCGYFESYVLNAKQLAQIEKEWAKVG